MTATNPLSFGQAFNQSLGQSFGASIPGLAFGAASIPFSLIEGGRNRRFQKSSIESQLKAADFAALQDAANQIMGLQAQAGENTAARVAGLGWGADLDFGRQLAAKRAELSEFKPKEMGLAYESAKRAQDLATSQAAKDALFQNLLDFKRRKGFELVAPSEAAFGRTAFSGQFTNV
jgi:hypothetical protein